MQKEWVSATNGIPVSSGQKDKPQTFQHVPKQRYCILASCPLISFKRYTSLLMSRLMILLVKLRHLNARK